MIFVWKDWSFNYNDRINADKIAQFGDFVGGIIGSIWALAGVILFYVALTDQRKDFETNRKVLESQTEILNQQIKEFELQRDELSQTRKVFEAQSKTLQLQQFESTFFNLLSLHHQIVNSIDLKSQVDKFDNTGFFKVVPKHNEKVEKIFDITTGRDCFVKFCKGFRNTYKLMKEKSEGKSEKEICKMAYSQYYQKHHSDLGHYFRNLYHIFKFVKNSNIENKKNYTNLVRAQLSNDELFLLFYNCISDIGIKFKPLIEEFSLLKHLNNNDFIDENRHKIFYRESSFK